MTRRGSFFSSAVLALGFLASSCVARAESVTLERVSAADFGAGPVGYVPGTVWPSPDHPVGSTPVLADEQVGGDVMKVVASDSPAFPVNTFINAWCADAEHPLSDRQTYKVGHKPKLAKVFGDKRANQVQRLINQRYSRINTKRESAALQVSIWAILYGTAGADGKYNLDNETFKASFQAVSEVPQVAQLWLDNLPTAPLRGKYAVNYLYVENQPLTQNVISFSPRE